MCSISDEWPSVYRASDHKARREHQCAECGRTIAKGERYHYAFAIYDGDQFQYHTCEHCRVGHGWLIVNCNTFMHCGLESEMTEHADEYPALAFGLQRILKGMRRKWRRFDGSGLMPIPPMPRHIRTII